MAVVTTFDQWQKDVFFSAAEAVQESADMYVFFALWVWWCVVLECFDFDGSFVVNLIKILLFLMGSLYFYEWDLGFL